MKKNLSMKKFLVKRSKLFFTVLLTACLNGIKAQSPCDTITVNPPSIDVRGNTDLCSGGNLQLCPQTWGYSNYRWYKNGVVYSSNSCIDVTTAGTYTLSGQNGFGCWSATSGSVTVTGGSVPVTPIIFTNDTTTFCQGGHALLQSDATTGNQWYLNGVAISGATLQTYNATQNGAYSVVVTNCGGSSSSALDILLHVAATPGIAGITGNSNMCTGNTSQLANATAGGNWSSSNNSIASIDSNGLVTSVANGNTVITYSVSNGTCTASSSITVTVSANTIPAISIGGNGSTNLCVNNPAYLCPASYIYTSYQWYKDGLAYSTNTCINVTTPGSYTLAGQNSAGCFSSQSAAKVITSGSAPATPTISTASAASFCSGSSAVLTSSSASGNQWYKDSVLIGGATSQNYTATNTGSYTVVVSGCGFTTVMSNAINVSLTTTPTVTAITGANSVCAGDSIQLADTTLGGTWSSSDTSVAKVNAAGRVKAIVNGNVIITYTVANGSCSASVTKSITVSSISTPVINVTGGTTICGTPNIQLCPATWGASNYQWYKNGVAFSTGSCINPTTAGIYTLQTQNFYCTSAISAGVTITTGTPPAATTISAGGSTSFCSGGSVLLSSTAAANYQWNVNGSPIGGATSQTYTANASGVYTVSVSGCGSTASNSITVTAAAVPVVANISGGASTICPGLTTAFTNAANGGTWASSNTGVATIDATTGVATAIAAGNTNITYTVTNGTCSVTKTQPLTVFAAAATPVISAKSATTFCQGGTVQMCPSAWGYSNYQWYKDGVLFSTASCINATASGIYTLSGQNGAGCWSSQSVGVAVTVNPLPTVAATTGANTVCSGSSVALSNASVTPAGGSVVWSSANVRATVNNSGMVTGQTAGEGNIRYTVTTAAGCSAYTDYAVTVNNVPAMPSVAFASGYSNPYASGGNFCTNRTFGLTGYPSGGTWNATGKFSIDGSGVATTAPVAGTGTLSYSVSNASGCSNARIFNLTVVACVPKGVRQNASSLANESNYIFYPNPARNIVNLQLNKLVGDGKLIVSDMFGKSLFSQTLSLGNNTINISSMPKGCYMFTVITKDGTLTNKIIKE